MKKHFNTVLFLLPTCRTMRELTQLHGLMITSSIIKDTIPLSKLIDFCTNSETLNLNYANSVFSQIHQPSVYIWNSMIRGYSYSDNPDGALIFYSKMLQRGNSPDHFTFPFLLKACRSVGYLDYGKSVHNQVLKYGFEVNVYVSTSLLNMYVSCEDLKSGLKVFDEIPKWNVVAWSSLISGYVDNYCFDDAIRVFKDMENSGIKPNEITLVHVLVACAKSTDLVNGKWVHNRVRQLGYDPFVLKSHINVILATSIVDMYAKCGNLKTARDLFDKMPKRNLVAWNSMIAGYSQYDRAKEAMCVFSDMRVSGFDPDKATFLSMISVSAKMTALALGQSIHAYVLKMNFSEDVAIGTALVDMYAKTGDLKSARQIFSALQTRDVMAWMSMIIGLAMHGHGEEALNIFKCMQEDGNATPDEITYIGVLCACSHVGLVEEGKKHFHEMRSVYGIEPEIEHYGCMVDLLSRAGQLEEAERILEEMPIKPSAAIWGALLNGCEIYENVNLADQVRSNLREFGGLGSGVYVLLSNIYAKAGKWQEVKRARELMKNRRICKTLGQSASEMKLSTS